MRARPMLARPENDDDAVYFLSDAEYAEGSARSSTTRRSASSSPTWQRKRYVSMMGTAEICADRRGRRANLDRDRRGVLEKSAGPPHSRHSRDARARRILGRAGFPGQFRVDHEAGRQEPDADRGGQREGGDVGGPRNRLSIQRQRLTARQMFISTPLRRVEFDALGVIAGRIYPAPLRPRRRLRIPKRPPDRPAA